MRFKIKRTLSFKKTLKIRKGVTKVIPFFYVIASIKNDVPSASVLSFWPETSKLCIPNLIVYFEFAATFTMADADIDWPDAALAASCTNL